MARTSPRKDWYSTSLADKLNRLDLAQELSDIVKEFD